MVAAAILVATSRHPRNRNRTHFTYDLYERDHGGRGDRLSTLAGDTARVITLHLSPSAPREEEEIQFLPQHTSASAQNDPAERDCARDPFSTGAALFSCQRTRYKPFTPGGSAGVEAPAQSTGCTFSDSRIASGRSSVKIVLSLCCHFLSKLLRFRSLQGWL